MQQKSKKSSAPGFKMNIKKVASSTQNAPHLGLQISLYLSFDRLFAFFQSAFTQFENDSFQNKPQNLTQSRSKVWMVW